MEIKGLEKLSKEQVNHMYEVNELHTQCVGLDYKDGMQITETWVDEDNCVCVRLKNGDWYHYTSRKEWY